MRMYDHKRGMDVINAAQVRMARGALGWSTRDVAEQTGLHHNTIIRIERGKPANKGTLHLIKATLEAAGVEFTNGDAPGVRLPKGDA